MFYSRTYIDRPNCHNHTNRVPTLRERVPVLLVLGVFYSRNYHNQTNRVQELRERVLVLLVLVPRWSRLLTRGRSAPKTRRTRTRSLNLWAASVVAVWFGYEHHQRCKNTHVFSYGGTFFTAVVCAMSYCWCSVGSGCMYVAETILNTEGTRTRALSVGTALVAFAYAGPKRAQS